MAHRLVRLGTWLGLIAAAGMVLQVAHQGRAMAIAAALPGYSELCTGEGIRLIPADPLLPPPAGDRSQHGLKCQDCCPPPGLSLTAPEFVAVGAWPLAPSFAPAMAEQPVSRIAARPYSRGPPSA